MAKKKSSSSKKDSSSKISVGVGLTAAAVAAAGTYFLYGSPKASQNRKKVKSWALKAKAEVLEALEDAQDMTEEEYRNLVEAVTGAYASLKSASKTEINDFKKEMMDHWKKIEKTAPAKKISRAATKKAKKVVRTVKKKASTKKAAKKAAKKSAKKAAKKASKK